MSTKRSTGTVLVVCAPSGAGKTTLIKRLREEFPSFGFSVSYTTRAPREGEVDGRDYHFISVKEFKEKRDAGFFAEFAKVHGNFYGSPLRSTLNMLNQGQDIIFDVDVQGASQLRLSLPFAVYIFIVPPSIPELERRLRARGTDSEVQVAQRVANALYEIEEAHQFDHLIVNENLDVAYDQIRSAYIASTLHPDQNLMILKDLLAKRKGDA